MFTGLVSCQGLVAALEQRGSECRLRIRPEQPLECTKGESVAINGVCLTVEQTGTGWFLAYASAETLDRSNLGLLRVKDRVNLEPALALGQRLGGHLVNGHVDCLALVESITPAGQSSLYTLSFPEHLSPYLVEKGSVCLDGISLTVNACTPGSLEVNIIPSTQDTTTIRDWRVGFQVNMEVDIIGKYVYQALQSISGSKAADHGGLTLDFLREHGF
jgi:riboflavin synthase